MPHGVFVVEEFKGAATNQLARMTNQPTRVVGRFDRLGGINPNKTVTADWLAGNSNYKNLGFDWLGVSVFHDEAADKFLINYSPTGSRLEQVSADIAGASEILYMPGGGIIGFDGLTIKGALFVDYTGTPQYVGPYSTAYEPRITVTTTAGTWAVGDYITAMLVIFKPTIRGYIPVHVRTAYHSVSSSEAGYSFLVDLDPALTFDKTDLVVLYVGYGTAYTGSYLWQLQGSEVGKRPAPASYSGPSAIVPDSLPVIYGAKVGSSFGTPPYITPEKYTHNKNRSFFVGNSHVIRKIRVGLYGVPGVEYAEGAAETASYVYHTDEGYVGYSDNQNGPNYLVYSDEISAIAPGIRGVYAFSEQGLYEAYGAFETGTDTRIDTVPVLGGIDDIPYSITPSGDGVYFINNGIVHKLSSGGVQQVGRPVFSPGAQKQPNAIAYDRFNNRLLARFDDELHFYYPDVGQWASSVYTATSNIAQQDFVAVLEDGKIYFNGHEVVEGTTPAALTLEFDKLDLQRPSKRKRIHRIIFDYVGEYNSCSVFIREHGTTAWYTCTTINRGDTVEARCPTVTARAFDLKIEITPTDNTFAINPPLIVTFEERGPKYDRY